MYELKVYRGVMFHDNEYWCKICKGIDLFQNWHEEFYEFWSKHSKVSKICTLMGSFWSKYIMFELKNTKESCFMTLKTDAKFEEKLTCGFENDMNLANFYQRTQKSQYWYFDGILLSNVENVWLSNLQRSYVSWQWRMQNVKRNWLVISKWPEEFDEFWPEH